MHDVLAFVYSKRIGLSADPSSDNRVEIQFCFGSWGQDSL